MNGRFFLAIHTLSDYKVACDGHIQDASSLSSCKRSIWLPKFALDWGWKPLNLLPRFEVMILVRTSLIFAQILNGWTVHLLISSTTTFLSLKQQIQAKEDTKI